MANTWNDDERAIDFLKLSDCPLKENAFIPINKILKEFIDEEKDHYLINNDNSQDNYDYYNDYSYYYDYEESDCGSSENVEDDDNHDKDMNEEIHAKIYDKYVYI